MAHRASLENALEIDRKIGVKGADDIKEKAEFDKKYPNLDLTVYSGMKQNDQDLLQKYYPNTKSFLDNAIAQTNSSASSASSSNTGQMRQPGKRQRIKMETSSDESKMPQILADMLTEELNAHINNIIVKHSLPYDKISDEKVKNMIVCAIHCCVNGPFSTHKSTKWGNSDTEYSIDSCFVGDTKVTSNSWRSFCDEVADIIEENFSVIPCKMTKISGGKYWPKFEYTPKQKK
jgi:hypothetical protein